MLFVVESRVTLVLLLLLLFFFALLDLGKLFPCPGRPSILSGPALPVCRLPKALSLRPLLSKTASSDSKAYLHLLNAQRQLKIFIAPRPSFNKARHDASAPIHSVFFYV